MKNKLNLNNQNQRVQVITSKLLAGLLLGVSCNNATLHSMERGTDPVSWAAGLVGCLAASWLAYKYWKQTPTTHTAPTRVSTDATTTPAESAPAATSLTPASAVPAPAQAKLNQKLFTYIFINVPKLVDSALKEGADANAVTEYGWPALVTATRRGNNKIVQILLDAGANVNAVAPDNMTALIQATFNGDLTIVQLLLAADADVNTVTTNGWTALKWATHKCYAEITRLLIQAGAAIPDELYEHHLVQMVLREQESVRSC